jgi:hypothetical protein
MGGRVVSDPIYVRYQADIWAEIAADGEVVAVVVDTDSTAEPVEVVGSDGVRVEGPERAEAIEAAQSYEWPSWDYGPSPVTPVRGG